MSSPSRSGTQTASLLRSEAEHIVRRLQAAGHVAVFAGGSVRDALLGYAPTDYDVATSARPEDVEALFEHTVPIGRQFGIVLVPSGQHHFEVATFRKDDQYVDGRRPVAVEFTDIETDARRRDFTINAMFEDPVAGRILDFVGGRADLEAGIVRAVGNARDRFAEDHLRLLRAVRFSSRLGFPIERETLDAVVHAAATITKVSAERIGDELVRMLTEGRARQSFELLDQTGLLAHVLPEISELKGCEQSPEHHPEGDVFVHTMLCLGHLPAGCSETLAFGVLLHDVAKPLCAGTKPDGSRTFYGHTRDGAEMSTQILRRLRRSNATIERVAFLVDQHLRHCSAAEMRASTLKRFLRQEGIDELMELARIDALSSRGDLTHWNFCQSALAELSDEQMKPPPLIRGEDLRELGMEPGPLFKTVLRSVEDAQLEGRLQSRQDALDYVRREFLGEQQPPERS
ncbi:MAG TPA: CCA tRNA nucleotidyltransferase [Candidatus Limnocylindrales bacterium]|nr:CCA tRNA nucleotidyltransferase [Candidatus Limnocylindrales bacterium]